MGTNGMGQASGLAGGRLQRAAAVQGRQRAGGRLGWVPRRRGGLGLFGVFLGVELAGGAVGPGGAGFDPLAEGADFHVGEGDLEAGHHALVEALAGDGF